MKERKQNGKFNKSNWRDLPRTPRDDLVKLIHWNSFCSFNLDCYELFILVINHLDAQNLFYSKFISCLYMFRAPCAHRQEVKIVLYSLWYHHTYRWPSGASWLTAKINEIRAYICASGESRRIGFQRFQKSLSSESDIEII